MSPNDDSKSHTRQKTPIIERSKDGASVTLRNLAPKNVTHYRPLAIRGSSESGPGTAQDRQTKHGRNRQDRRCAICFKRDCPLKSHKFHDGTRNAGPRDAPMRSVELTSIRSKQYFASYALSIAALYDVTGVTGQSPGLLDQLPVPADLNKLHMQQLFHRWFVEQAPRHFTVARPKQMKSDLLHSPFVAAAFNDSVLCLSILTVSVASQLQPSTGSNSVLALSLFDRTMRELRECVKPGQGTVADTTIVAAIYLWAASLYLIDNENSQQHASSVRALIDAREGIENLGMSGAAANLFKWVDIVSCLRLNQASQFPDSSKLTTPSDIVSQNGSHWTSDKVQQIITADQALIDACRQCCETIRVVEHTDPDDMDSSTYFFLYQRAAQLYQESSVLRARYSSTGTVEECVVLAIDILKLIVFNGGQTRSGRRLLRIQADFLSSAVRATGGGQFWQAKMHLFVWIMFLNYVSRPSMEYRTWSAHVLRGSLEHCFGPRGKWSDETIIEIHDVLYTFGWLDVPPLDDVLSLCESLWI